MMKEHEIVLMAIEILPVDEESEEISTIASIEEIRLEIQREFTNSEIYTKNSSADIRGIDPIIFICTIAGVLAAKKDVLTPIISKTVELLAKREHVQEIKIMTRKNSLVLKDVRAKDALELINATKSFAELELQQIKEMSSQPSEPLVKVQAKASKRGKARK